MAPAVPRSFSREQPISGRDSSNIVASGNARLQPTLSSIARPARRRMLHLRLRLCPARSL